MHRMTSMLTVALLTGVACAQTSKPGSVQNAETILEKVAQTYRQAEAFTDHVEIQISQDDEVQSYQVDLTLQGRANGSMNWMGWTMQGGGENFYITKNSIDTKYIRRDIEGDFISTLNSVTNGSVPLPHLALMEGRTTQEYARGFGLGQLDDLNLIGYEESTVDGLEMYELKFSNGQGEVSAMVNKQTSLIRSMVINNGPVTVVLTLNPEILDALPSLAIFNPQGKREVEAIRLEKGDPAPDFELKTLEGESVRLSDLKGSMVVLDFWATWCGPCMRGLPVLNQFNTWAQTSGYPISVYAIDAFERDPTEAQKRAKIEAVWNKKGFGFPTLLDFSQQAAMAYEVGPIPHSVIIDAEGRIHEIVIGYDAGGFKKLKAQAEEIFSKTH